MHASDDLFLLQPIPSLVYQCNIYIYATFFCLFRKKNGSSKGLLPIKIPRKLLGGQARRFSQFLDALWPVQWEKMPRATGGLHKWSVARYDKGSPCWYFGLVQSISGESMWVMFFCTQIFLETLRDMRCWSRFWRVLIWRKHGGCWWLNCWWSWASRQIAVTENTKEFWFIYGDYGDCLLYQLSFFRILGSNPVPIQFYDVTFSIWLESKHKLSINSQIPWIHSFEAAQITTDITKKQTQPRLHWASVVTNNVARAGTGHWRTFVGWQSTTFGNSAGSKSGRLMLIT